MQKYTTLEQAIRDKKSVTFSYKGYKRVCSPHTLGYTDGEPKVLTYQYGGSSSSGKLPPGGEWRCFNLADIVDLTFTNDDNWHTGKRHSQPQSCVKTVKCEVSYT